VLGGSAHEATSRVGRLMTSRSSMRGWSAPGLLFAAGFLWAAPVSAQMAERSVEVSVDSAQRPTHRSIRPAPRRAYRGSNYAAADRYWRPAYVAGGTHYGYVGAPYGYWPVGYVYATRGYVKARPK
jgi:hypothetical protein